MAKIIVVALLALLPLPSQSDLVAACYRRMDVVLADCQASPGQFDTWTRQGSHWTKHSGINCYGGHGAKTAPGPEPYPNGKQPPQLISLSACQTACTTDSQCTGIVTGMFKPAPPPPPPGGIPWNPGEQIAGPSDPSKTANWLKSMQEWRAAARNTSWYKGTAFDDAQLRWTQTSYIQPQMHPYDRYFFDPTAGGPMGSYTVDKWVADVNTRYGGVDSILMWPTYTNIGIDDRSQFDLFEAMPGGIEGVRSAINQLHAHGIKVLIPYNPWDAGTARCGAGATCGGNRNLTEETARNASYCAGPATAANPGFCDARIIDSLIQELNADGFNGDTMGFVPEEFYDVSMKLNHSVAIEPEGGGNVVNEGAANWDTMGWGYWGYPWVPSVDSWKWQDSRRMTNVCERWSKNHTNALQYALFNGDGFESWENVWGTWNGITQRDGEQIRRVGALLRFLGGRGYLQSQDWTPHVATSIPSTVFASRWPTTTGDGSLAWTLVNRDLVSREAAIIHISADPRTRFFDLYNGVEVYSKNDAISVKIERFGAILATRTGPENDPALKTFLAQMAKYSAVPISDLDPTWRYEKGSRVSPGRADNPKSTEGMIKIPGGPFLFVSQGIEIEGSGGQGNQSDIAVNPFGVDFQYEWEAQPSRFHSHMLHLPEFWIDATPVTQSAYAAFLAASPSAIPMDRYHYLKNWDWSNPKAPVPFAGNGSLPVTYIGLDEAREFCRSIGKRLPREEEWQFAATGGGNSTIPYPWGTDAPQAGVTTPPQVTGNVFPGPEPVGKYKAGASPFGVLDLVGNVWQYTDEYQDDHTRSVCLKGGANYRPSSSMWYFPQTIGNCWTGHCGMTTNQVHNKYFLMNPRYERAGTVGFRCAADVPTARQSQD